MVPGLITRLQALPVFRGTAVPSLELFADRLAELPLVYQPGTRWSYSMGLDLMGRVIEVVTGQCVRPLPAGARSSIRSEWAIRGFQVPRANAERMTTSYFLLGQTLLPIDLGSDSIYFDPPPFPFGGSGLASTPRDYDKFLAMLVGRGEYAGAAGDERGGGALGTSDILPDTLLPEDSYKTGPWATAPAAGSGAAAMPGSTAGPARRERSASSTPAPGCAQDCSRSTCRRWPIR